MILGLGVEPRAKESVPWGRTESGDVAGLTVSAPMNAGDPVSPLTA
jgi:hypothetical protein